MAGRRSGWPVPRMRRHRAIARVRRCSGDSGLLVIDDTQALGIFGKRTKGESPYGSGGGGSLRWHALQTPRIVAVSSLAKAFGAPVAVVAGSARLTKV